MGGVFRHRWAFRVWIEGNLCGWIGVCRRRGSEGGVLFEVGRDLVTIFIALVVLVFEYDFGCLMYNTFNDVFRDYFETFEIFESVS